MTRNPRYLFEDGHFKIMAGWMLRNKYVALIFTYLHFEHRTIYSRNSMCNQAYSEIL